MSKIISSRKGFLYWYWWVWHVCFQFPPQQTFYNEMTKMVIQYTICALPGGQLFSWGHRRWRKWTDSHSTDLHRKCVFCEGGHLELMADKSADQVNAASDLETFIDCFKGGTHPCSLHILHYCCGVEFGINTEMYLSCWWWFLCPVGGKNCVPSISCHACRPQNQFAETSSNYAI